MSLSYVSYVSRHGYPHRIMARHNSESLLELPGIPGKLPVSHFKGLSLSDLVSTQETANGNSGNNYGAQTNEILDRLGIDDRFEFLSGFNGDAHYGATLVRRAYAVVRSYGLIDQETHPLQNDKDVFIAAMVSIHKDGEFLTRAIIEHAGIDSLPEAVHNGVGTKLRLFQKELYGLMSRLIH